MAFEEVLKYKETQQAVDEFPLAPQKHDRGKRRRHIIHLEDTGGFLFFPAELV